MLLVALSGTTTIWRPIGEDPQPRAFVLDVMREVVAVGRAYGVDLPEDRAEGHLAFVDRHAHDMTSCMHHDLERGNTLEVRWLAGGVVELGARAGILTRLNRAIAHVLAPHVDGPG